MSDYDDRVCVIAELKFQFGHKLSVRGEIRYGNFPTPIKPSLKLIGHPEGFSYDKFRIASYDSQKIIFSEHIIHDKYGRLELFAFYFIDIDRDMATKYPGELMVCRECNHGFIHRKVLEKEMDANYPYHFEDCYCGKVRLQSEYKKK